MAWISVHVNVFVFMEEHETTNNTMLTKIQGCAFVKVTSIHLAWQSPFIYLAVVVCLLCCLGICVWTVCVTEKRKHLPQ